MHDFTKIIEDRENDEAILFDTKLTLRTPCKQEMRPVDLLLFTLVPCIDFCPVAN